MESFLKLNSFQFQEALMLMLSGQHSTTATTTTTTAATFVRLAHFISLIET